MGGDTEGREEPKAEVGGTEKEERQMERRSKKSRSGSERDGGKRKCRGKAG